LAGREEDVYPAGAERFGATRALSAPRGLLEAVIGLIACLLSLWIFWPGITLYDSVDQYRQVLTGEYLDWHPPAMARLWSLFAGWWSGGAPMLLIQIGLYWLGLGLLAAACARRGHRAAGWAVIAIGIFFLTSCWISAILKDSQMLGAMLAATGIVAWFRLQERAVPAWAVAAAVLLLSYAAMVRANALFAVIPLSFALLRIARRWPILARAGLALAATLGLIAVMPAINHRLLGAAPSGVEKSLMIYDLAGIAADTNPATRACYSAREWDEAGEPGCSGFLLLDRPTGEVAGLWIRAILHHPLAYARHRLIHFDTTMRWIVPANLRGAISPVQSEPNSLGLGAPPRKAATALHRLGARLTWLPIAWPAFWLALDLVAFWAACSAEGEIAGVAFSLSLSALVMGTSFLVVSVASDSRYHLWTMIASALAIVLLAAARAFERRHLTAGLALGLLVSLAGLAARLSLSPLV
jgi:hypothetical protein